MHGILAIAWKNRIINTIFEHNRLKPTQVSHMHTHTYSQTAGELINKAILAMECGASAEDITRVCHQSNASPYKFRVFFDNYDTALL